MIMVVVPNHHSAAADFSLERVSNFRAEALIENCGGESLVVYFHHQKEASGRVSGFRSVGRETCSAGQRVLTVPSRSWWRTKTVFSATYILLHVLLPQLSRSFKPCPTTLLQQLHHIDDAEPNGDAHFAAYRKEPANIQPLDSSNNTSSPNRRACSHQVSSDNTPDPSINSVHQVISQSVS